MASMTFPTFSLALASGLAVSGRVAGTSGLLTKMWGRLVDGAGLQFIVGIDSE